MQDKAAYNGKSNLLQMQGKAMYSRSIHNGPDPSLDPLPLP